MKTLLIPTDFSENAENALRFAALLAKKQNAKIILHHSFQVPIPIAEIPYDILREEKEQFHKDSERKLKTQAAFFEQEGLKSYRFNIGEGSPGDTIVEVAKENRADMIIMGTKGADGLGDAFFGTTATYVMEHATCPVMAIPAGFRFNRPVKTITYATDYRESDLADLVKLADFAGLFKAQLNVLHISDTNLEPLEERALMADFKNRVTKTITYPSFSFQLISGDDVGEKLETYVAEGCTDILGMSTHKRNFLERIFGTSTTREMGIDMKIPIIAFHYDKKLTSKLY
ncbi:hypothetical protein CNR22_01595 [Sphingobacteriaceae bacterium]|nr:hypothetical protein CNR22_01595 [Sphingobacteriaceae bacterium]